MADPKKTPAVPTSASLRFKVHARSGRAIAGATVTVTAGTTTKTATSDAQGAAKIALMKADVDATSGAITVSVKKFHYAPDPGPMGQVAPGPLTANMTVSMAGFDPTTPNVAKDTTGLFLDCVLMDGGMSFAAPQVGVPTRRLTDDQVQQELMFDHLAGTVTLNAASDFVFDHDASMGEFDACDPAKCKVKTPPIANRVALKTPTIGPVTFFVLLNFSTGAAHKADVIPGQHFLADTFDWGNMPLQSLDQRHVVGLARLCAQLNSTLGVVAIYTQGVNGDMTRTDCHGYGMALDFGGVSTTAPDPTAKHMTVRMGIDFIVFLHWGRVPMWDSTTVAANPSDSTTWTRQAGDDGFNYSTDATGATHKLHYRLDPAPFQDSVPSLNPPDPTLSAQLAAVAGHFSLARAMFKAVFDFASSEYADSNTTLGQLTAPAVDTPTAIDDQSGHFILHPDYGTPNAPGAKNGRQAHVNHLHFQVGPTHYGAPRTT
jgi:hypothetical protein